MTSYAMYVEETRRFPLDKDFLEYKIKTKLGNTIITNKLKSVCKLGAEKEPAYGQIRYKIKLEVTSSSYEEFDIIEKSFHYILDELERAVKDANLT